MSGPAPWSEYLRFRSQFKEVLDPRFHTIEWLDAQVLIGEFKLFTDGKSCILVKETVYPTGLREIHGVAATGELKAIRASLIPTAIKWAIENGCVSALIESRRAWEKILKADGWELHQVSMRKWLI